MVGRSSYSTAGGYGDRCGVDTTGSGVQAGPVRHRRYLISDLRADGTEIPSAGGDLLVASHEGAAEVDWELVHRSSTEVRLEQAPYQLEMDGVEGSFSGPAVLVRSDGRSHVFRGAGPLAGFDGDFDRG